MVVVYAHYDQSRSKLPVSDVQLVESELNCTRRVQKENEGKKIIKRGDLFRPIFSSSIFASALLSERVEQAMERGNTRARETETRHPLGRWHASPLLLSLVAIFARFNWGTTCNLLFTFRITGNKWRSAAYASVRLGETHINLSCGAATCFRVCLFVEGRGSSVPCRGSRVTIFFSNFFFFFWKR